MIQVSIIIVNYNTTACVAACIQSIEMQTQGISYEIVLVDNHSADQSVKAVAESYDTVQYISLSENVGFGKACNIAVASARGAFLLFLNPDTLLKNNAMRFFYDFWQLQHKEMRLSCIGAVLQEEDGALAHSGADFPKMRQFALYRIKSVFYKILGRAFDIPQVQIPSGKAFQAVDYVTGANLFTSKENFELVAGFDARFFMYFEESDLQYQLAKYGLQAYLVDVAKIVHVQGASFQGKSDIMHAYYKESMMRYFRKYNSPLPCFLFQVFWNALELFSNWRHKPNKLS